MSTRRDFIKQSGLLVVGLGAVPDLLADPLRAAAQAGLGPGPYPDLDFRQLDSWIVVRPDNTATFYVGKTDLGQGTGTAFRQIMADELDMAYDRTSVVMGTTDVTVDQGGSGGSDALQTDGWPMRRVAAEARRVLLDMASNRLGVPAGQLAVSAGRGVGVGGPVQARELRRADWRPPLQRDTDAAPTSTPPPARRRSRRCRTSRSSGSRRGATTSRPKWTARCGGRWTSSCRAWCTRAT